MVEFLVDWWLEIINFFLLVAAITIFVYKKLYWQKNFIFIGMTLIITLVIEVISTFYSVNRENNLALYHLLYPVQLLLISFHFKNIIDSKKTRKLIVFLVPAIVLAMILSTYAFSAYRNFPSFHLIPKNVILILLSLSYFKELLHSEMDVRLQTDPQFWVVSGILICSLSSLVVEGCMSYVIKNNKSLSEQLFYVTLFISYLFYTFIIISFSLVKNWKVSP